MGNKEEQQGLLMLHQAVTSIVELEEEFEEEHRKNIEMERRLLDEEEALLESLDGGDCDLDKYTSRLDEILSSKMARMDHMRKQLVAFRKKLAQEEAASKSFNQRGGAKKGFPVF